MQHCCEDKAIIRSEAKICEWRFTSLVVARGLGRMGNRNFSGDRSSLGISRSNHAWTQGIPLLEQARIK